MKKILVVDDNRDILQVVEIVLEIRGYDVKTIWDGKEVIEAVKDYSPHVVLLDVLLGNISGITICNELKSNSETKDLCIIMFSAHANQDNVLKLCPADGFLSKPFDIHNLVDTIEAEMGKCA
ncbi:MAG TPA: response regulator [Chitinophagaceae bacterium]|nr:response regulator [Chitinophagaceae bacterium]